MSDHAWHSIAYEATMMGIESDAGLWHWCSRCGSMRLGSDTFYIGGTRMIPKADTGCADVYISLDKTDAPITTTDGIEDVNDTASYVDPFDVSTLLDIHRRT